MKNKFCAECRRRPLEVASERVRTVTPEQRAQFANTTSPSLWTNGVRVVNQTSRCSGPAMLVYKHPTRPDSVGSPVEEHRVWYDAIGRAQVRLIVSKGTLVPVETPTDASRPLALPIGGAGDSGPSEAALRQFAGGKRPRPTASSGTGASDDGDDSTSTDVGERALLPPDRATLVRSHAALERMVSQRLAHDAGASAIEEARSLAVAPAPEEPLTETETMALESVRLALRSAAAILSTARAPRSHAHG